MSWQMSLARLSLSQFHMGHGLVAYQGVEEVGAFMTFCREMWARGCLFFDPFSLLQHTSPPKKLLIQTAL